MTEFSEWKGAREWLAEAACVMGGGESASVDLEGFGTLTVEVKPDPEGDPFTDSDVYGSLHWPDRQGGRPSGVDGSGRKFDTRSGPVWWMPPADVKQHASVLEACAERVRRYLAEDWCYVGLVLTVSRPHEASTSASLWACESDLERGDVAEILDGLFADLPPAPPLEPVWVVIRDFGIDYHEGPEVDVFNNEAAAREHASRIDQDNVIVREETVASSAWAPVEAE